MVNAARSHSPGRPFVVVVAALLMAAALALAGVAPAAGDTNEGTPGDARSAASLITVGSRHSCAVISGEATCWGDNVAGQLGNGTTVDANTPTRVQGLTGVVAMSAGDLHTCAALEDGTAWCWGDNVAGQLGNGSTTNSLTPVAVVGLSGVTAISSGGSHACAIAAGEPYCWGFNGSGGLGNGESGIEAFSATPVPVLVDGLFTAISGGAEHTCATRDDGTTWCWGRNLESQLGFDSPAESPVPVQVPDVSGTAAISTGGAHTCAVEGQSPMCWGDNRFGQVGNGSLGGSQPGAGPVSGLTSATAISAGVSHSCALPGDGSVRCWGDGQFGRLGTGDTEDRTSAASVVGLTAAVAVSTGTSHTCALLVGGEVLCWGLNNAGQLGNGTNGTQTSSPQPVPAVGLPGAPEAVTARPGFASATVSFDPPAVDGGVGITSYEVVASPGGATATGTSSPITVEDLDNGSSYTFTVRAVNVFGAGPASQQSNEVTPSAQPFYEVSDVSVVEGDGGSRSVAFTITRFGNTSGVSSVKYATADGSATASEDYVPRSPLTALWFFAGQDSRTVNVTVKGDEVLEPDETFSLDLYAPGDASTFDATGVATIVNDDATAAPSFSVDDVVVTEGDSGTVSAVFTVTRSGSTASAASVDYRTNDGTATAPDDYTARGASELAFSAGQSSRTIAISVRGDVLGEADESFTLALSAPVDATIADDTGVGTIVDDDFPATPSISVDDVTVVEGDLFAKNLVFTLTRSGSLAASSSVVYETADGTAVAPADYTGKGPVTVTFWPGQSTKTVTVRIRSEQAVEPDETFDLVLSSPIGAVVSDPVGTATITDDD